MYNQCVYISRVFTFDSMMETFKLNWIKPRDSKAIVKVEEYLGPRDFFKFVTICLTMRDR